MTDRLRELEKAATPAPWVMNADADADGHIGDSDGYLLVDVFGGRLQADSALIAAMRNALPLLLDVVDAARDASTLYNEALALFARMGIQFDKWPDKHHLGTWSDEQLAALDPETRWQGVAFTLYTMLALEVGAPIETALAALDAAQ